MSDVYVDPSALARLYIHQEGSKEMSMWRARIRHPLTVTHHGRTEIVNAICRCAFLEHLNADALAEALADLKSDFASGHLKQAEILWRSALNLASDLSERYTPELGTRSLDVLHVACALELQFGSFLTFDVRQQELARRVGLKLVRLRR